VEVLGEPLPHLQGVIVEGGALVPQVVRADDGSVAAGVAAADPAFLEDGHIAETVVPGQVISRSQAVAATPDDDGVICGLRLRLAPLRLPVTVTGQASPEKREAGEALHRLIRWYRAVRASAANHAARRRGLRACERLLLERK